MHSWSLAKRPVASAIGMTLLATAFTVSGTGSFGSDTPMSVAAAASYVGSLTASKTSVAVGESITVTAKVSPLPKNYKFKWGDGSVRTWESTNTATKSYSKPGTYTIVLDVAASGQQYLQVARLTVTVGSSSTSTAPVPAPAPAPIVSPSPTPPPPPPSTSPQPSDASLLYFTDEDLASLPRSGRGWEHVKKMGSVAPSDAEMNLGDMDQFGSSKLLAAAILYRLGEGGIGYAQIESKFLKAMGTEANAASPKDFYRHTAAFLTVARVAGIPESKVGANGQTVRAWVTSLLDKQISPKHPQWDTIRECSEVAGHNFGAYARSARVARALYLGDAAEVDRVAYLMREWLGDVAPGARGSWAIARTWSPTSEFKSSLTASPYPSIQGIINPVTNDWRNGVNVEDGGRQLDSAGRPTGAGISYQEGSLEATTSTLAMLYNAGYTNAWRWGTDAVKRNALSVNMEWPGTASDRYHMPHIFNYVYGTSLPEVGEVKPGHSFGFGEWLTSSGSTWMK